LEWYWEREDREPISSEIEIFTSNIPKLGKIWSWIVGGVFPTPSYTVG
jgi:hypothetical protein